jgi:hypothetical protein
MNTSPALCPELAARVIVERESDSNGRDLDLV